MAFLDILKNLTAPQITENPYGQPTEGYQTGPSPAQSLLRAAEIIGAGYEKSRSGLGPGYQDVMARHAAEDQALIQRAHLEMKRRESEEEKAYRRLQDKHRRNLQALQMLPQDHPDYGRLYNETFQADYDLKNWPDPLVRERRRLELQQEVEEEAAIREAGGEENLRRVREARVKKETAPRRIAAAPGTDIIDPDTGEVIHSVPTKPARQDEEDLRYERTRRAMFNQLKKMNDKLPQEQRLPDNELWDIVDLRLAQKTETETDMTLSEERQQWNVLTDPKKGAFLRVEGYDPGSNSFLIPEVEDQAGTKQAALDYAQTLAENIATRGLYADIDVRYEPDKGFISTDHNYRVYVKPRTQKQGPGNVLIDGVKLGDAVASPKEVQQQREQEDIIRSQIQGMADSARKAIADSGEEPTDDRVIQVVLRMLQRQYNLNLDDANEYRRYEAVVRHYLELNEVAQEAAQ